MQDFGLYPILLLPVKSDHNSSWAYKDHLHEVTLALELLSGFLFLLLFGSGSARPSKYIFQTLWKAAVAARHFVCHSLLPQQRNFWAPCQIIFN